MDIKRQGCLWLFLSQPAGREGGREADPQPADFMDLIFGILTTADSRPSITSKLPSVTPCGFSHSFLPAPLPALLLPLSHSPLLFFLALRSPHLVLLAALRRVQLQALAFFFLPGIKKV